ncbi:hypothetical protein [Streptomyces sp. NPDC091383]|uniref:hypothetical protein n=1 Tax=Streptomyces sp. NPDC091383 TaxID=3365996 RepID=UPI0037F7C1F5
MSKGRVLADLSRWGGGPAVEDVDGTPRRIDPAMDLAAAAQLLGCSPAQVGYCPRCQDLSRRYRSGAEVICRACRAAEASSADGPAR